MRGWSFPLGRWFGIDLRIHTFFLLVLGFCLLPTGVAGVPAWRGIMLWLLLLMTVFVREVPRLITAAYHGLQIRSILLLPIGGLFSYATPESAERASEVRVQTSLALTGPIANLFFAAVVAGLVLGATTGVPIAARPWIAPTHLIRSTVWLSAMLGLLNLLPVYPLDAGRILRSAMSRTWRARIGYLFAKNAFKALRDKLDPSKANGSVVLGLNGIVVKSHGGADAEGFAYAVDVGYEMAHYDLLTKINQMLNRDAGALAQAQTAQEAVS